MSAEEEPSPWLDWPSLFVFLTTPSFRTKKTGNVLSYLNLQCWLLLLMSLLSSQSLFRSPASSFLPLPFSGELLGLCHAVLRMRLLRVAKPRGALASHCDSPAVENVPGQEPLARKGATGMRDNAQVSDY